MEPVSCEGCCTCRYMVILDLRIIRVVCVAVYIAMCRVCSILHCNRLTGLYRAFTNFAESFSLTLVRVPKNNNIQL